MSLIMGLIMSLIMGLIMSLIMGLIMGARGASPVFPPFSLDLCRWPLKGGIARGTIPEAASDVAVSHSATF